MQGDNKQSEDLFFDAYDYSRSSVDSTSSEALVENCVSVARRFDYDFWMSELMSVRDRRAKFLQSMGFHEFVSPRSQDNCVSKENLCDISDEQSYKENLCYISNEQSYLDRITESSGSTLDPLSSAIDGIAGDDPSGCIKDLDSGKKFTIPGRDGLSSMLKEVGQSFKENLCDISNEQSYLDRITESGGATLDPLSSAINGIARDDPFCCIKDLDSGKKFIIHDPGRDGLSSMLKEVGSERLLTFQEFDTCIGLSCSVQHFMQKEISRSGRSHSSDASVLRKKEGRQWWRNLKIKKCGGKTCRSDTTGTSGKLPRMTRVKVHQQQKKNLEFSALYMGQEIKAHEGLIRTMKFSPSGSYLASGGEDCVVRIWKVREVEPLCKCRTPNGFSSQDENTKDRKLLGTENFCSAPIVIPKKVVIIEEKPVHEFCEHLSEILDLAWSISDVLLTSSKDKTVRMWKVGFEGCLKVFQHNDYVTCLQFNPVDERYFISGSIDGKVRIWTVHENRVVDWVGTRDIVTTVCYQPDGKGFVIGSISGDCRFYDYSGESIQLGKHLHVQGKRKSSVKPITGLQFSPEDSRRVMVQSVDSKLQIHDDVNIICKFRGLWKCKTQSSASFTSDGRHIVSVGDDSHVYIWNYNAAGILSSKCTKAIRSCEHFFSEGVSVAVPWSGLERRGRSMSDGNAQAYSALTKLLEPTTWVKDPDCFSLGIWFFADASSMVSPTWLEEKLPGSHDNGNLHHHHQNCHLYQRFQRTTSVPSTWSVVLLTGSRDGFIRSFHNYGLPIRL